jgi:hypothetical protein
MKIMLMAAALSLVGGLSFGVPSGHTTDVPDLNCVQVERGGAVWVVCTETPLDDDEVDAIIERGEAARELMHAKPKGKPL